MKVLVVEDNPVYSRYVCNMLAGEGLRTETASSLAAARKQAERLTEGDIVLADLRLPDGECTNLLEWMRGRGMGQCFIVMTDYAEVPTAVRSMKLGSEDYIPKRLVEERLPALIRAIRKKQEQEQASRVPIFKRTSEEYKEARQRAKRVAPTNISVLVRGENGTGKEHFARYIHEQSKLSDKPFVAVDCGSLAPSLAASAFFGHRKGAFTGADCDKAGYFQEAEGGTLFLDEVGNLPMETQQALLRAIQERTYRPVGAKEDRCCKVRIVAATNEDLKKAVAEKRFRLDLYHRLCEYTVTVPPLRDSRDDIMPLAEFFREQANMELECEVKGFDASARKALLSHPWPGNVRELRLAVRAAVLHTVGDTITARELEIDDAPPSGTPGCLALKDEGQEKERILRALEQANGNRNIAANLLGIGRTTLYRKMTEYGLKYGAK